MKQAVETPNGLVTPTIDFGPHAGEELADLPTPYLQELLKSHTARLAHVVIIAVRAELAQRQYR